MLTGRVSPTCSVRPRLTEAEGHVRHGRHLEGAITYATTDAMCQSKI